MKITIYTKTDCVQCDSTKRMLDKADVSYNVVDLENGPQAMELVKSMGYNQAPVVVTEHGHWSGFRVDHIKALITEAKTHKGLA